MRLFSFCQYQHQMLTCHSRQEMHVRHEALSSYHWRCCTVSQVSSSPAHSNNNIQHLLCTWKTKLVPYSITSIRHGDDPSFLVTLVINSVVGCQYFPPGPRLLSQPKRSPPWAVPHYTAWWQRHPGVSSLPKAATQWWQARTRTHNM